MCGISGEIRFDETPASVRDVARMTRALAPRGPDDEGLLARGRVALGHRRLKIIDLSPRAEQPMADPALGLTVVFNGCIYNHVALREELQAAGYRFFSDGDTEVVLKAWHAWGAEAPEHLKGMFAFAVHERDTGRVALARDRMGIKPLYLARSGKRLRFASSLPAILAAGDVRTDIDRIALSHYMSFHAVVPPPRTLLSGVAKLPPATVRVFEPDGRSSDRVYWRLDYQRSAEDAALDAGAWKERIASALDTAIQRRMLADVPVGVLLSGGVDSSLIVAMLARAGQTGLRTFSIGFEDANGESGDEFTFSDRVAAEFATEHSKMRIPTSQMLDALPHTIAAMSEPMVSYDNVGFFLLSREVSRHVKVVQSGQGADEVFAGYHWYPGIAASNDPRADYRRLFLDRDAATLDAHLAPRWHTRGDPPGEFIDSRFDAPGASEALDKALRMDTTVMLVDDPVKRVDNMTMAWGLEARVPFLDHELVELAARAPPALKLAGGGKGVLKDVARDLLPAEVVDRPKGYFPVPALKYLAGPVLEMTRDALASRSARERGLFRTGYLQKLFDDPSGHITPLRGSELWQCALLEMWLQTHAA